MEIILDAEDISEADLPRDFYQRGNNNNSSPNCIVSEPSGPKRVIF
jgi:hypothetical protein